MHLLPRPVVAMTIGFVAAPASGTDPMAFGNPAIGPAVVLRDTDLGDVDGDGDLDVVAADFGFDPYPAGIRVSINRGDASFEPVVAYGFAPLHGTVAVALGDLDADDDLDVVALFRPDNLTVDFATFFNQGDGTYIPGTTWPMPDAAGVAAADFDGDGDDDLAVPLNLFTGRIRILWNDGTGSFTEGPLLFASNGTAPHVTDFDGDGDPDILSAARGSQVVWIFWNDGGVFTQDWESGVGWPYAVTTGDIDRDGDEDLVTTGSSVIVVKHNGAGGFCCHSTYSTLDSTPRSPRLADLDRDFDLDLVIADTSRGTISVMRNDGTGAFGTPEPVVAGDGPGVVDAVDMNGDAIPDPVVAGSVVGILLNSGTGQFATERVVDVAAIGFDAKVVDLDGDGLVDLATPDGVERHVGVRLNDGTGAFAPTVGYAVPNNPTALLAVDVTGSAHPDLAVTVEGSGGPHGPATLHVFTNAGDGTFGAAAVRDIADAPQDVFAGELTGDTLPDLVTTHNAATIAVLRNGAGGPEPAATYGVPSPATDVQAADLTGDDRAELIVACPTPSNGGGVHLLGNAGDGTFSDLATLVAGWQPIASAAGDLDADDDNDLAVVAVGSSLGNGGGLFTLENLGGGVFAPAVTHIIDVPMRRVLTHDLDGDGDLDVAAVGNDGVTVLLNPGDGVFGPAVVRAIPYSGCLVVHDFDGDGLDDLIASGTDTFSIICNDGSGVGPDAVSFLGQGIFVTPADVDGDGDVDMVNAPTFGASVSIAENLSNVACAADVDGDGVVGVNDLVQVILGWGQNGGPADVNGDGIVDVNDLVDVMLEWGEC